MALSAIWDVGGRVLALVRRVEDLFKLQAKLGDSIVVVEQRLRAIEDRLLKMEADGPQLISEARSAASAAATAMSGAALNDVVTRLTRVEVKLEGHSVGPPQISAPTRTRRKPVAGDRAEAEGSE
jgi:hypothetical protein